MSDVSSKPQVRLAALQRERAALESKPYQPDAQHTKERRLAEIDAQLAELGVRPATAAPASSGRREKAV